MRKLIMFNMISIDGYFEAPGRDISWHTVDSEFNDFAIQQLNAVDAIIFGRITYELMVSYWPTPEAQKDDPAIAALMNHKSKIVCSTTLDSMSWNNTQLIKRDVPSEMKRLKAMPGKDLIIFGSGQLCASLAQTDIIDEYRIMISPITLGAGTPLFRNRLKMTLQSSREFANGNLLLTYSPASP